VFSLLISSDLAAGAAIARHLSSRGLVIAHDVVYWASYIGLLALLPYIIVCEMLEQGTDIFDKVFLGIMLLVLVCVLGGLAVIKRRETPVRDDLRLQHQIRVDRATYGG